MTQVFISYKREDQAFAETLRERLIAWGYQTWMDVHNIPMGVSPQSSAWADAVQLGLESSDVVVGVMSALALKSENVKNEWDWTIVYSKSLKKRLLLLKIDDCIVHQSYVRINRIDWPHDETGFTQLQMALQEPPQDNKSAIDPYADYLRALYERINKYLSEKIIRSLTRESQPDPIPLRASVTQGAVLFEKRPQIDPLFQIGGLTADEPPTEYDDFGKAFDYYGGRVLLLGAPGAGKTITLLHHARNAVVLRMQDTAQPLPIFGLVTENHFETHNSFAEWVSGCFAAPHNVSHLIEAGETLLVLDGLDELGRERIENAPNIEEESYDPRERFISILPDNNRIIVTCRTQDYEQIGRKINLSGAVTLKPLDEAQMRAYLHAQPELLKVIETDSNLRSVIETPLLLSFFAFAYEKMKEDERQQLIQLKDAGELRDAIFKRYIEECYNHEARKPYANLQFTLEEIYQVLGYVAMVNTGGYIRTNVDKTDNRYRISNNVIERVDFELVLQNDQINSFTEFVQQLHLLIPHENGTYRFIHVLLRDYYVYDFCLPRLRDWSLYYAWRSHANPVNALGRIGDVRSVPNLIRLLEDSSAHTLMRVCTINALGTLGDIRAIPSLIAALNDESMSIRTNATIALGLFRDPRSIPTLITALKDGEKSVGRNAGRALVQIGESSVLPLTIILREGDTDRRRVVDILRRLRDPRAVPSIISALMDKDTKVRATAVQALKEIGDKQAIPALIAALRDRDISTIAARALGKIGGQDAVPLLVIALRDEDVYVRRGAANALAKIRDKNTILPLIAVLNDRDIYVRHNAVRALAQIGVPAVPFLIDALIDIDKFVRLSAADILGQIRDTQAVMPLISLLRDKYSWVRWSSANALGKLRDARAVEPLISLLTDGTLIRRMNSRVCDSASKALQRIGTREALKAVAKWRAGQEE